MINAAELEQKIADSGLKIDFIADSLGISRQALWEKRKNKQPFNAREIVVLCKLLNITEPEEKVYIFLD